MKEKIIVNIVIFNPGSSKHLGDITMNQETNLDKALEAIRNGEFVLVFDDDDREGEVDMIIASEFVTPKSIATMRNDAGGLICNCLHADFCDAIHLPFMVDIMAAATEKYPELAKLAPNDIPYDERSSFSMFLDEHVLRSLPQSFLKITLDHQIDAIFV